MLPHNAEMKARFDLETQTIAGLMMQQSTETTRLGLEFEKVHSCALRLNLRISTTRPSVEKSRHDQFFPELRRLEDAMGGPELSCIGCREFLIHDRRLHPNLLSLVPCSY